MRHRGLSGTLPRPPSSRTDPNSCLQRSAEPASSTRLPMRLLLLLVGLSTLLNRSYTQNCKTPCLPNAKCEVLDEVAACFCSTGYTGNGITICEDVDECNETSVCGDHAACENTNGGFSCFCMEGYQTSTGKTQFTPNDGSYCQEIVNSNCHLEHDCIAANINKTLKRIGPITEQLTLLHEIYKNSEAELSLVDIVTYIEILTESSSLQGYIKNTTSPKDAYFGSALTEFGKTINNFVEKNTHELWDQLPTNRRRLHLTKLMHAAEHVTLQISQNIQKNTQFDMNSTDLALKVFIFDSVHMKHTHPHMNVDGGYVKISPRRKSAYDPNGNVIVAFLCYRSIGPLLSSSDDFLLDAQSDNSKGKEKVISSVISASISSNPPTLYELEKITFTLSHVKLSDKHQTQCAFWNYSVDDMNNGSWSSEGCELTYSNDTHTSCRCSHLTHFAILMSPSTSIGVKDYNILTRITQLGIIISLICLAICIFTFWFFSEIQSTRTTIHKNLCCSLFLAQLVFLIGININTNKLVCSIIAGLLHYFFLAAFAWMCIEGIYLYLIVVGLIYNKGFLHKNFYIFGYLSPAVVVGFSASLGYRYYGTTKVCWLSTENNFIWSFIGPACLIILVNLLAFGVIIYKVFRHTAGLKPEVSCYENIRSCARGALALLFLLGTTWTFGVLHVVHASVVTAYLFTVSNAFQGMFIFLFLCVLSRKIQEEYYRLFKNVPCCFECLR